MVTITENTTLEGLGVSAGDLFTKDNHLKSSFIQSSLNHKVENLESGLTRIKHYQGLLDQSLDAKPVQSTSVLEWISGGLNTITFNFLDWVSNGTISSFDRQNDVFQQKLDFYNDHVSDLKESINLAKNSYHTNILNLGKVKGDLANITQLNADKYAKSMTGFLDTEVNKVGEKKDLASVKVLFNDFDRDLQVFNGFAEPMVTELKARAFDQVSAGEINRGYNISTPSYKDDILGINYSTKAGGHFLNNDEEKIHNFLMDTAKKANTELAHFPYNADLLSQYKADLVSKLKIYQTPGVDYLITTE